MSDSQSIFWEAFTSELVSRVKLIVPDGRGTGSFTGQIQKAHEDHLKRPLSQQEFSLSKTMPKSWQNELIPLPGSVSSFEIQATLVLVIRDGSLLLGMKKRGFGQGLWNGFGGKIHSGESAQSAAIRELNEESKLTAVKLEKAGTLSFIFDSQAPSIFGHIYTCTEFKGAPGETGEMKPEWFSFSDIPYDMMWADDRFWLPFVLEGRKIDAAYRFDEEKGSFSKQQLTVR